MSHEKVNPAALADAGRARNSSCLLALDGLENNPSPLEIQQFRAAWFSRRAGVSNTLAATLAPLAFGSEAL